MGQRTPGQKGTLPLTPWGQPHSTSQEMPRQGPAPYATCRPCFFQQAPCPGFKARHTGTRNSVCPFPIVGVGSTWKPLPAAAHLHTWDTRGAVFAIDARETLQKEEELLGLTPLRGTERLMVGAKKGWEGKGKLQPCAEPGCKDTRWLRTGQRGTDRSSCKGLSPRCGHGCRWLYLHSPPWGRCLLGGP